ncbi:MAG: PQQ-like beta-propeller repeat protein [Acidobacteria bacterium]|nr:PQQ-like beta-propeller repeat protein [Acidobacteriota bacterium]MCI0628786.1 PQQ-like beta-propeller repeat protein [Acidobacteriota bacterium]MCI0721479.1 PQQ-like beta-propeller repeat protein [Acidobacteriota bacterium]
MQAHHWLYSWKTMVLASVLFPPLGLILVWTRPSTRLSRRILNSIYISALTFFYLYRFVGLRVERDGSGMMPMFSFQKSGEAHYAELEKNRARHAQLPVSQPVAEDARSTEPTVPVAPGEPAKNITVQPSQAETPLKVVQRPGGSYWTDFRGPKRDGAYDEMDILTTWPAQGLPLLWKQPIGGGYASFVVATGRAFTIEQRRSQEVVAAYDLETGRELWTHSWDGDFRESMGGDGPRATPAWHEGRLYALGALGELRCLQAKSGKLIWNRNILSDNQTGNLQWGMSAAPLVVDDNVIVLPGGRSGKSVVAYNKDTGAPVWQALDDKQAYTSPMLVTLAGQRQVLIVSAQRAAGLTAEDGKLLWDFPWTTSHNVNSAQPLVVGENRLFISAGYGHGAALVEVTLTSDGFSAKSLWQNVNMKNKFNSSVYYQGHIYGLDEAILSCIDAETGERKWKGGRYGYGQLLLASGHLIILTESGDVVLVKATPESHVEVSRFSAIEGRTWNHPALASGRLLLRNTNEMACFKISK